ncbi:FadR family transcriptional regulator [Ramlibacter ginsenosidimutans]|uniref:FadR family transcriptional regulator n=1 Tax=Ramlibacter ginsenosidimutans TaxID=502333 RepID=A0A934WN09_9BURK|nr:FadR/GntR family transcriptional regulator [Ramlibacter ginsenosidimutans]MBK6007175.1 FadR family transcriptional regulator [Ramlibacter ginsenosidimutans]
MNKPIRITQRADATEDGYDRVLSFLRDELMSGRLKTGDRLLPERDLASALGVSRPVIREALTALSTLGAVEIRRGYGTVVREPNFTALADYFGLVLAQQAGAVDDVMQARIAIERQAIRLACTRALAPDLERLSQALQAIKETIDDPARGGAADFHFHSMLVEAAHSPALSSVYAAVAKLLRESHLERRKVIASVPQVDAYLIDHHEALLSAVRRRNPAEADALLTEHFEIGANLRVDAAAAEAQPRGKKRSTQRA